MIGGVRDSACLSFFVRETQNKTVRNRKKLLDFNTYAFSMGFLSRTIFEDRLPAFATT
jgi:hypothetical protein